VKCVRQWSLPADYLELMRHANGTSGLVGRHGPWLRIFPLDRILLNKKVAPPPAGLLPFAGNAQMGLVFDRRGRRTQIVLAPEHDYTKCRRLGTTLTQALVKLAGIGQQMRRKAARACKPDVIFVPTPQEVVNRMLRVAKVTQDDLLYDLGCGDGRMVITAARKYGARAVGFELDPECVREARARVKQARVQDLVRIRRQNIFTVKLKQASVITLYLPGWMNERLLPELLRLPPGVRIVAHNFFVGDFKPKYCLDVKDRDGSPRSIYLWVTPL
jgi:hypothetical protein